MITIIGSLKFLVHKVNSTSSTADEEKLHDSIIKADEARDEVQISGDKHHKEQNLRFATDACTASGFPDFHEEKHDGQEMRKVSK